MKSVMISINPKWCSLIASGEKTIEVRKTKPSLETPFKCYIYCTGFKHFYSFGGQKVIGEFVCDRIYELAPINHAPDDVEKQACLTREEIVNYIRGCGYGWHINDPKIYDKPKELSEFRKPCKPDCNAICNIGCPVVLKSPPRSWCYCTKMSVVLD